MEHREQLAAVRAALVETREVLDEHLLALTMAYGRTGEGDPEVHGALMWAISARDRFGDLSGTIDALAESVTGTKWAWQAVRDGKAPEAVVA